MRVAVISNGARSLLNFRGPLMVEMVRRGHEVLALAPDHDADTRDALSRMGIAPLDIAMTRSGTAPLRELRTILQLQRLLRVHRVDVCFAYFLKPTLYGMIAARLAGVKRRYGLIAGLGISFAERPGYDLRQKLFKGVIIQFAKLSLSGIDRLMFQNPDDLHEFVSQRIVPARKAVLVGATGVDMDEWAVRPMPGPPITFVLAARLLRDKGVGEYVDAARIVRATHPDARFLLLGGNDDNPSAFKTAEVEAWVAEGLIEWPGNVAVKDWLAQAHIFVLPSYYREGIPRSTQEAMAMGRPVITADTPGCRETVVDGINGFLVAAKDASAVAEAMKRFIDEPELAGRMGTESRRIAEERFDVHELNRNMLAEMNL